MTSNEYNQKLDQFKATLGHGTVTYHLYKLTATYVQLTRWRKYHFNCITPRQIKHVGDVATGRLRAYRDREERKRIANDNARAVRGTAMQEAIEALSA